MNCLEFRRALGVNPAVVTEAMAAHRADCARCAAAYEEAVMFEQSLERALAIDIPEGLAERILLRQTTAVARERRQHGQSGVWRWAAGLLLAIGVGAGFVQSNLGAKTLGAQAAEHVRHEPHSLSAWTKIPPAQVNAAFLALGVRLALSPTDVNYLSSCPMADETIVHMVTQRPEGPVTVLYLPSRQRAAEQFEHDGLKGRVEPLGEGTLVLLASDTQSFDGIESEWRSAFGSGDGAALGSR